MSNRRRSAAVAVLAAAALGVAVAPANATPTPGTGSVVTTVAATVLPGALTITGTGAAVAPSQTPNVFGAALGATAITVADLTGSTNGWAVTATYSDPATGLALGGSNVQVSAANVVPDALGGVLATNVNTVADQPLTTPVTVATTSTNSGAGVTAMTGSFKVRVPATAVAATVYGATVTYTVSSVR